ILESQGALAPARRQLLEPLVQEHIKQHANDPQKSLAALSSAETIQKELEKVADADLLLSLAGISAGRRRMLGESTDDAEATVDMTTGTRFRILRPHAQGGLGQVFVALDQELQREVALKEIQSRHAHDS